jgi:hypothetical protein
MANDPEDIRAIWDILAKEGEYTNPEGIELEQLTRQQIHLTCKWPGFREISEHYQLDLGRTFNGGRDLAAALNLHSRGELDRLSPSEIVSHYKRGALELTCMVFDGLFQGELTFTIVGTNLFAFEATGNRRLNISQVFAAPDQYVQFTIDYFIKHPPLEGLQEDDIKN